MCRAVSAATPGSSTTQGVSTDSNRSNPINGAGGNKYTHEIDLAAMPESPQAFERHYNATNDSARSLARAWLAAHVRPHAHRRRARARLQRLCVSPPRPHRVILAQHPAQAH